MHNRIRVVTIAAWLGLAGLLTSAAAEAPPAKPAIAGLWLGTLKVGAVSLRLVLQIESDLEGRLTGKLISLDQGNAELPFKKPTFTKGQFAVELPDAKASFTGTLDEKAQRLKGQFSQGGQNFDLEFTRIDKIPVAQRPQTPKPPFPYEIEEVAFENAAGKFKLAGTFTRPKGNGPFPALALVSGSGPQDRDETLLQHKPFLILADHLTRAGFAVLRYDDRGTGQSGGKFAGSTTAELATDAHAALQYLRSRKDIDAKRVGLLGHSEGGIIAPMVAAEHPSEVAFIVLLAAPGVSGEQILLWQTEDIMRLQGESQDAITLAGQLQQQVLTLAKKHRKVAELQPLLEKLVDDFFAKLSSEQRKHLVVKDKKELLEPIQSLLDPWMLHFIPLDPAPFLKRCQCPVLALIGEKDCQVRAKENTAAIAKALQDGGNKQATIKILPGLNHLFQACKSGSVEEYGVIEETINPAALKAITDWLKSTMPPDLKR